MPRVKRGIISHYKHKKLLLKTKGYRGRRKNVYRVAKQAIMHANQYAYKDRRNKKRVFRSLWISKINLFVRNYGLTYNKFIFLLKKFSIEINRKMLSEIIIKNKKILKEILKKIIY